MAKNRWLVGLAALTAFAVAAAFADRPKHKTRTATAGSEVPTAEAAKAEAAAAVPAATPRTQTQPAASQTVARAPEAGRETSSAPAAKPQPERGSRLRRMMEKKEEARYAALGEEGPRSSGFDEWFYSQRTYPGTTLPLGARLKAIQQAADLSGGPPQGPGDGVALGETLPPGYPLPAWIPVGPSTIPDGQTDTVDQVSGVPLSPVSGRLISIAPHPSNPDIVYAGAAQGGVWKTTNATSPTPTWTPLTDRQASMAAGSIAVDPVDPNIVYVGTGEATGSCSSYYGAGLLRSTNGGATWSLFGGGSGGPFTYQSISKVIVDPVTAGSATTTTVWATTALGVTSSGTSACNTAPAVWNGALWRSTNSGQTWQLQDVPTGAALPNARIHDMVLDPSDVSPTGGTLYVGVRPLPSAANGGIWKSANARTATPTFTKLAGGLPNTATASPAIRRIRLTIGGTGATNTLYASFENATGSRVWGVYKTTDAGASWAHLDNLLSGTADTAGTAVTRVSGPAFATDGTWTNRRFIVNNNLSVRVASVTDADHLTLTATAGTLTGAAFSVGNYPGFCDGQCFYDITTSMDPADATGNTVYVGGNPQRFTPNGDPACTPTGGTPPSCRHSVWKTTDGGATWRGVSQGDGIAGGLHTDDHALVFDSTGAVLNGNDGGIWRSVDAGASWTSMNTNIAITQFQSVAQDPTDTGILLGGTQDNGTNLLNAALQPPPAWFHADFGDGGQAVIDQSNPQRMFHTYFNQAFNFMGPARSLVGGSGGPGSWDFVGAYFGYGPGYYNGITPTDPVSFYAPLALHPAFSPNVVYFGSNRLYRAPDPQPTITMPPPSWTAVSPVLTKGGSAFLLAISPLPILVSGKEIVYTGASDGRVEVSANVDGTGVATWKILDGASTPLPPRAVSDIEAAPNDPTGNTAYVTFSGFDVVTPTKPGHVFKTTNGITGAPTTWTNVSGDLPDTPATAIIIDPTTDPPTLYVGTDIGVFRSLNDGVHWDYMSNGHPVVAVFGLDRNPTTGQIVSSTHGRGMFVLDQNLVGQLPACGGAPNGTTPNTRFDGTVTDDSGVGGVSLRSGSSNVTLSNIAFAGPSSLSYRVTTTNLCLPGTGVAQAFDIDGQSCLASVNLPGNPVPGAPTAGSNSPLTVGDTLNLTASDVTGATYAWTGPNGFTSSAQNPSLSNVTTAAAGSYSVTATVGGCASAAGTTSVTVNCPSVSAGNNGPLNVGDTLNLTATTVVGATYSWTGPNGFTSSDQNPSLGSVTPAAAGTYTVTVSVGGCSVQASTSVVVNCAAISVNPSTLPNPVPGVTYNQTLTASGGTGPYTFAVTAGSLPTGLSLSASGLLSGKATSNGTFTVTATDASGCTGSQGYTLSLSVGLTIGDMSVREGRTGTHNAVFSVTLNAASPLTVSVDFTTQDGTATTANNDYTAVNGTLTFAPGVRRRVISVPIIGDATVEPWEYFSVLLSNPVNASIVRGTAKGVIGNDDR